MPELSDSLQKVIAPAISKEIANNQDVMIDALYPIMGGMISKYVTQSIKELMEQINRKIENGLSTERFKRKLKAKFTGVSETELLMEESSDALISALFVIHKDTGLLISSASMAKREIDDPQMVASMASAIKDFINDWINKHQENKEEIQILSYGNATLYIESAGSVYVIAFLDSEPDYELRSEINRFFASIVKQYALYFQNFDGDDSAPEVAEISQKMQDHLLLQTDFDRSSTSVQKHNPAKLIFLALGVLLLGYGGYIANEWYKIRILETQIKQKTAQEITLNTHDNTIELNGYVDTLKHIPEMIDLIGEKTGKPVINHLILSTKGQEYLFAKQQKNIQNDEQKLTLLQKQFSETTKPVLESIAELQKKIVLLEAKEKEIHHILHLKDEIASKLFTAMENNPFYNKQNQALDFAKLHLFSVQQVDYNPKEINAVKKTFEHYLSVLLPYRAYLKKIIIEGHSDSSGAAEKNMLLTQKRADVVKTYLLKQPFVQKAHIENLLVSVGSASKELILVNDQEDHNASRRIMIRFELDPDMVYETMQKVFNIQQKDEIVNRSGRKEKL